MGTLEIKDVNDQTITDLFLPCNECIYWEAPNKFHKVKEHEAFKIKQDWFRNTQKAFGNCGKIVYAGGKMIGYSQYAPPDFFENVAEYSQEIHPPDPKTVLISCLYIQPEYQRKGLGRKLLQAVINELAERGLSAVETYSRDDSYDNCSGPTEFYVKNGFKILITKKLPETIYSHVRLEIGRSITNSNLFSQKK